MKNITLTAVLSICVYFCCFAQSAPAPTATIKGSIADSATSQPLGYVTVALVDAANNPVKSTLSKEDGSFVLAGIDIKPYKLTLINVGYATKTIAIDKPGPATNLGKLLLLPVASQLQEVSVTAVKPLMKREVDRISYDVQADPESKVITVLDMLRKVPMVSVDATDNIKLQGNTNFKILINGKPSALIAKSPADIFKAMPASNIEKIEVITTPPAKYDAEGLAGILNIITKKDADQGYNGSINTRYSNIWGYGTNLNLTVKQGKFGLGGYVGYNKRQNLSTGFNNLNDNFNQSYLTQQGTNTSGGDNTYASTELSYEGDSLNLLTGNFEYYKGNNNSERNLMSNLTRTSGSGETYQSTNTSNSGYRGLSLGLNYQLGFKRNKEQLLTGSYKYNSSRNTQFNDVLFVERVNYDDPNYRQYNNSGTKEHTLQLDYVQPLKKLNIEAGAKAIYRNNFSDIHNDVFDAAANGYVTDDEQANTFDYQQNVYSLYNSYQLKLTKWVAKGGLRLERTTVDAAFIPGGRQYSNLIPSLSIQRTFGSNSLNLSYTDRIQRPGIWQLNPFVNRSNNNFINVGNPDLRAVLSHGVELNYSNFKKGSINVGLNYKFANNTIENVTTPGGADAVSVTTYQNVGKNKRLGIDVNVNYPITSKMNVNLNTELMRVWIEGYVNSQLFKNSGMQGHVFGNTSYKFDNGYRLGVSIDYDSRYVMLQGTDNFWFGYSASASKELLNKKATISLYVSNPLDKFRKIDNTVRTPTSYQYTVFDMYARAINISFNYKFGRLNSDIKKNQRGISNDDVSGGSRN